MLSGTVCSYILHNSANELLGFHNHLVQQLAFLKRVYISNDTSSSICRTLLQALQKSSLILRSLLHFRLCWQKARLFLSTTMFLYGEIPIKKKLILNVSRASFLLLMTFRNRSWLEWQCRSNMEPTWGGYTWEGQNALRFNKYQYIFTEKEKTSEGDILLKGDQIEVPPFDYLIEDSSKSQGCILVDVDQLRDHYLRRQQVTMKSKIGRKRTTTDGTLDDGHLCQQEKPQKDESQERQYHYQQQQSEREQKEEEPPNKDRKEEQKLSVPEINKEEDSQEEQNNFSAEQQHPYQDNVQQAVQGGQFQDRQGPTCYDKQYQDLLEDYIEQLGHYGFYQHVNNLEH